MKVCDSFLVNAIGYLRIVQSLDCVLDMRSVEMKESGMECRDYPMRRIDVQGKSLGEFLPFT